ncbi:MAG TPA: PAS domain S-box protein [Casimicrobiaceae bacterium]|nr:PAS domain S-box protein [Casimicrobiaceae bacterium]
MPITRSFRVDAWIPALLFAVGTGLAVFAGLTIVSWHALGPVQIAASFDRIQYDAAWAIAFAGAALALHAIGATRIARLFALVPLALGSVRLAAWIGPDWIPVHPMLVNPWLPLAAGSYNDMGVLTALIAIVIGAALLLLLRPGTSRTPWHAITVAMLTSIALALSLLVLFAAWSGSTVASESLQLTGGERTTGAIYTVLAATMLGYAMLASGGERKALRRSAPLIVWLAVFACTLVLWRALTVQETRFIQRSTALVAADARGQIQRDLYARIDIVARLADRSLAYTDREAWKRDAEGLLKGVAAVDGVSLSGADYIIQQAVPSSAEVVVGLDRRIDPVRRAAIDLAVNTRRSTLTPFLDLIVGGEGLVLYVPVFQGDEFRAIIAASLARTGWPKAILDQRFPEHYIEIVQDGRVLRTVAPDGPKAADKWSQDLPLVVQNAHWTLRATPTQNLVAGSASPLPVAALALGTILATLLALSTYLFQAARANAKNLKRTNERLVSDIARRYHVEQELRESESRTSLIINAVKDCAIYMLDTEGQVASWNPGAQALNGYTAAEITGKHFSVLYPPDRKDPPEKELEIAARRGWYEEECWHVRKDGSRYCGDDIISAIRDEPGNLRGFSVVTRDATMRLELREQTERARDFYFSLFSGFPNLVWRSDTTGACDYLNQAWLEYTGRKQEEEFGSGWMDGVHPDDRARWQEIIGETFPAQKTFEYEFRLRRVDGTFGSMICNGRPYYDMQGRFAGYLNACYDNTARRAMESALKESEARYQGMTANVPGMVFELLRDPAGKLSFSYVSEGVVALTGATEAALIADSAAFFDLVAPAERPHLDATLEASAAQLSNWSWSGRIQPRHEATERWITIRARPRQAENAGVLWDGVVFDDTQSRLSQVELERSREELRELSRHLQTVREEEKQRIAREVHDELGATLSVLKMDLESLDAQLPAHLVDARAKRSAMIQLVDSAVATTRKIVTDLRPSILDDLGLAAALRWQIGEYEKHTKLGLHLDTPDPDIAIDRERGLALFRIFQETVTNVARHANATNAWIGLTQTDRAYVLTVRDDGGGMSEEDLRKPMSHGVRGMRERAQHFGGNLSVSSTSEGTTVVVTIPKQNA